MDSLAIGIIGRSHGIKGEVKVRSLSGDFEHFYGLNEVVLRKGEQRISAIVESVRGEGKELIMKFSTISTPEQGKTFSGWEIWVDRVFASRLNENEYYVADLCQCRVMRNQAGFGKVIAVLPIGGTDLLEILPDAGGKSFLVPFINQYIGNVDLENCTVELKSDWEVE